MKPTILSILLAVASGCADENTNNDTTSIAGTCATSTNRIVDTKFPQHSVVIAVKDVVADFGADSTGKLDASAQFQAAIDAVAELGGGTLWVPAGTYRFDNGLTLHDGVTLHGDWKRPTGQDRSVVGSTVLAIRYTDGPFVTMTSNTGMDGLAFWYPQQTLAAPKGTAIAFDRAGSRAASSVTIMNVTFVNPAIGILTGTSQDTTIQNIQISGVYGAALDTALVLAKTVGGGTQIDTHLGARYWSESGLAAPAYADVASYMRQHATAIEYMDNWRTYNVTIDDFATGILFIGRPVEKGVTGPRLVGFEIHGAQRAIDIEDGDNFYINNAVLDASQTAIFIGPGLGKNSLLLNEVAVSSGGVAIDDRSPDYTIDVVNSTFSAWKDYAIKAIGADVIVAGSKFTQNRKNDRDLWLGAGVAKAIIMSNTFADGRTIDSAPGAATVVWIKDDPLVLAGGISGFASSGLTTRLELPEQPLPARVGMHSLYDVSCFGAVPDCTSADFDRHSGAMTGTCTDNTPAFQKTLDAAGKAGGGTVYVPGSTFAASGEKVGAYYLAGKLTVPDGVELTSADGDRLVDMDATQTMLVVEGVDGDPTPIIALGAHAGLRGITVWYANQDGYAPGEFGYAVQARGAGDWMVAVNLPNATYGADFATYGSDGHYISKMRNEAFRNALAISKSKSGAVLDFGEKGGGGYADGVVDYPTRQHLGDGHWVIANPPDDSFDPQGTWIKGGDGFNDCSVGQIADAYKSGVGIRLGAVKNELVLDAYVHAPHVGLQAYADGALGGPTFTLIEYGTESFTGLQIDALGAPITGRPAATIVSAQYHTISTGGYPQSGPDIVGTPYLVVGPDVPATSRLAFFTLATHSYTPIGFDLSGGDTVVQQLFSSLENNDAGNVEAAVRVRGALTGFAAIAGKFINPLDPGVVIANGLVPGIPPSPNVALAGVSLASHLRTLGPVDLSFQPPW